MESDIKDAGLKNKLLVKGCIIVVLILLLLIPASYIQNLIQEREQRQKEAAAEVNSKWAGRQNIAGPILCIPYLQYDNDSSANKTRSRHIAYFLPDELNIKAVVTPQKKYRGIYKVMLYTSKINVSGSFSEIHPEKLNIQPGDILWNEAFLRINIADVKGLNESLKLNWNNKEIVLSTQPTDKLLLQGLVGSLHTTSANDLNNIQFSTDINLNGSEQLLFTPLGNSTTVNFNSPWPDPSFTGDILPQSTVINNNGFIASWKSLSQKRNFPQQWKDEEFGIYKYISSQSDTNNNTNISTSAFGADLFIPVNGYQKTMRSVKYAILCILLTFSSFFIIETLNKKSVHPFQYALVGLALLLFYTLLLSFSEYISFNAAYAIASVATISLIAWFVKGILQSGRPHIVLSIVLVLVYSYVFTILQLQDYALLLGSIGLFLTLAVIMYFSRKIQW